MVYVTVLKLLPTLISVLCENSKLFETFGALFWQYLGLQLSCFTIFNTL